MPILYHHSTKLICVETNATCFDNIIYDEVTSLLLRYK